MNNQKRIWRVHMKDDFYRGPYRIKDDDYSDKGLNINRFDSTGVSLKNMINQTLLYREPYYEIPQYIKYRDVIKKGVKYSPTLSKATRPGWAEDGLLRANYNTFQQNIKKRIGKYIPFKYFYFAFSSKEQVLNWFSKDDLDVLSLANVMMSSLTVPTQYMIEGYKQCMVLNWDVIKQIDKKAANLAISRELNKPKQR